MFGYITAWSFYSMFSGEGMVQIVDNDEYFRILNTMVKNNKYRVLNVLQLNDSIQGGVAKRRDFLLYLSFFNRKPDDDLFFYI